MSTNVDFTTVHGSNLIGVSDTFCCGICGAPVALVR